jgi:hypothetical protein
MDNENVLSLRAAFLANNEIAREEVYIARWHMTVWVWEMSAGVRDQFEQDINRDSKTDLRARMVVATVRDDVGNPLFTKEDIPALSQMSGAALGAIFKVALRVNAMRPEDVDALEKKSEKAPTEPTACGSPNGSA